MGAFCLQHKIIDASLFQYNMPLASPGKNNKTDTFVRMVSPARAMPGVTWRDIVSEFKEKRNDHKAAMSTVTWIEHRYIVSMSVYGFFKGLLTNEYNFQFDAYVSSETITEEKIVNLAKSFVQTRDYEAAGGYFANPKINSKDYWPKD